MSDNELTIEDSIRDKAADALTALLLERREQGNTVCYRPIDALGGDIRIAEQPYFSGYLKACDLVREFAAAESRQLAPHTVAMLSKAAENMAADNLGLNRSVPLVTAKP